MNINKLFPRLSIRAKLQIAFALVALVPLGIVAAMTTVITVARLRAHGVEMLRHDLNTAQREAARAFAVIGADVAHVAEDVVAPSLCDGLPLDPREVAEISAYIARRRDLFRLRVIDWDGVVLLSLPSSVGREGPEAPFSHYYHYRGTALSPGARLFLPVEVVGTASGEPTGALAVIVPVFSADRYCGTVIGEAYAGAVFEGVAAPSPLFAGLTALVDSNGFFLYHSRGKSDWNHLLATTREVGVLPWLEARTDPGSLISHLWPSTRGGYIVQSAPIPLAGSGTALTLIRAVPVPVLFSPVKEFMTGVVVLGVLLTTGVLLLAGVAAAQLSKPVYQLHRAAGELAAGRPSPPLSISSNDEIEDLSHRFQSMAVTLTRHREELERLVAERTRRLEATHAELAQILAGSADAIISLDAHGKIRLWNPGAEALLGYPAAEVVGEGIGVLLPDGEGVVEAAYIAHTLETTGAVINLQTHRVARDGTRIPVSVTQTVIRDPQGGAHGMSIILRDTRQQQLLQERMRASERLAAVSMMAAGLAHEINNPVAILTNRIECMEADLAPVADSQFRRDLAVLRDHVERLGRITGTLRDFARQYDDRTDPLDLPVVVEGVRSLLEPSLAGRGVILAVDLSPDLPHLLIGAQALETVLMNLVLNAADAMPGGGHIRVTAAPVPGTQRVELLVADEGPGIPPGLRDRIFEPFFSTKSAQRGMGLGLALVRSMVERVGGTIRAEGDSETGGHLHVVLPAVPVEDGYG